MKIEISNGELLDKISILELKLLKIGDEEKLVNIKKEFETLNGELYILSYLHFFSRAFLEYIYICTFYCYTCKPF